MSKANGHRHAYRPVGEPWRRERARTRVVTVGRYRNGRRVGNTRQTQKECIKTGPMLQTVYCAGCADRREIVIRQVCS